MGLSAFSAASLPLPVGKTAFRKTTTVARFGKSAGKKKPGRSSWHLAPAACLASVTPLAALAVRHPFLTLDGEWARQSGFRQGMVYYQRCFSRQARI